MRDPGRQSHPTLYAVQHGYSGAMIDECRGGAGADIRPPSTGGIHFADFSRCAAGAPGGYAVLD